MKAVLCLLLGLALVGCVAPLPQLFDEARAQHPDVWYGCRQSCLRERIEGAPFLPKLAEYTQSDLEDLTRFAVVRSYQWGLEFESLYGRPPGPDDWKAAYVAEAKRLQYVLRAPTIFAYDDWPPTFRYSEKYK